MAGETQLNAVLQFVKTALEGKTITLVEWNPEENIFIFTVNDGIHLRVSINDIIKSMLDN